MRSFSVLRAFLVTALLLSFEISYAFENDLSGLNAYSESNFVKPKKRKKKKSTTPIEAVNWRSKAAEELIVDPKNQSAVQNASPATVVTTTEIIETPVIYSGLQIGLTLQSYRPQAKVKVLGQEPYDASEVGSTVMTGVLLRWLPWELAQFGRPGIGFSVAGDYSRQSVRLLGDSGADLGKTYLHSGMLSSGVVAEWILPQAPEWILGAELSAGRMDLIQTSVTSLASNSEQAWFLAPSATAKYRLGDLWLSLSYARRLKVLSQSSLQPQENGLIFGLLYGLR